LPLLVQWDSVGKVGVKDRVLLTKMAMAYVIMPAPAASDRDAARVLLTKTATAYVITPVKAVKVPALPMKMATVCVIMQPTVAVAVKAKVRAGWVVLKAR